MFEIEKNVPIIANGAGMPKKYPLMEMEVGDSFFIPTTTEDYKVQRKSLSTVCCHRAKLTGRLFAIRKVDGGLRVWRTK